MTSIDAPGASAGRKAKSDRNKAARAAARLRDRLFRSARRHTILVRILRVLMPAAIVAGFAYYGLILATALSIGGAGKLLPGKIEITASDLKMKNPSYFGVTKEGGKYEVRAREAAVDFTMTGPVKLEGIDGDLLEANGVKTRLIATRGALDNKKGELELFDGVDVDASNGMRAQLERAMIYTKEHRVVSRDPVRAEMPTGTLTANAMDFVTDQRLGHFRGNVNLRLTQQPTTTGTRPSIGIGGDAKAPVDIQAQEFDIDDLKSLADFRGTVVARQGETQLTAPELHVTYEGHAAVANGMAGNQPAGAAPGSSPAAPPGNGAQMSRLVARTGVILTAGSDRRVVAEIVDFDVKADTALFTGNVELLQAKNVFRGGRLFVDRKAGRSRLDTPSATPKAPVGRIGATLVQTADPAKPAALKPKTATSPAAIDPATPFSGFHGDPNAPTDIEADSLDVIDPAKQAIFRGRVVAKQSGNVITASEMIAHFTGQTGLMSSNGADPAAKGTSGAQLTLIETKGGTKIVSKDGQEAEGANAHFDMKTNVVTLDGPSGVSLRQGNNGFVKGCRVRMDMGTGEARVETCAGAAADTTPTPAQLSIAAKPGVAPPTQPTDCPPGKMCAVILHPDQLQKAADGTAKAAAAAAAKALPTAKIPDAVRPQTSPSAIYRSN